MSKAINILLNRVKTLQVLAHEGNMTETIKKPSRGLPKAENSVQNELTALTKQGFLTRLYLLKLSVNPPFSWKVPSFRAIFIKVTYDNFVPPLFKWG